MIFAQNITLDTNVNRNIHLYEDGYTKSFGVKMYPGALTYKTFYTHNKAIEASGYITLDGFWISAINEKYTPIKDDNQLSWYIGYGGHFNIWSEDHKKKLELINPSRNAGVAVGIDGILGLDYKIKGTPLNVSVDWQPSFNFVGDSYFENGWGGIGVRYTF